jgi:hypothetical protein
MSSGETVMRSVRQFLGLMLIGIFVLASVSMAADTLEPAKPQPPNSNVMAADALIGRPLGLGMTVLGTGAFVATLPFSICSGSVRQAARGLVREPAWWTFKRPLGQRKEQGYMLP